jgi:hypothetical protein
MKFEPRTKLAAYKAESGEAWIGAVLFAVLCLALLFLWPRGPVSASTINHIDADGDGVTNAQEQILGTNENLIDSDGDGYSDSEEFARDSSPTHPLDIPLPSTVDLTLSARGDSNRLVVVFAAYIGTLQPSEVNFSMGGLLRGRVSNIPPWYFMREAWMTTVPGMIPGTSTIVVEMSLPPHFVHALGSVSLFGVLEDVNTGAALAADVVDIGSSAGVIYMRAKVPMVHSFQQVGGTSVPLAGSVYLPIPPGGDGDIPMSWTPGQVCFQKTQAVGAGGGLITHEVVEAECRDGWDAYCKMDCSGSVGSTYNTLDPAVLVGG